MNRLKILMICVFCLGIVCVAKAQDKDSKRDAKTYVVNSLEGRKCKIHILPNYPMDVLKIRYKMDTITIGDYWGVPATFTLLGNTFLEIDYAIRAGSNVGSGHTLVFCISRNHLHKCMYVMKYLNGDAAGEQDDYHINLSLKGDNIRNYKLIASITDKAHSKDFPEGNYNYHNLSILSFDRKNNAFYSIKAGLYEEYEIVNEDGKISKQKLHGYYPEIILGQETYCYIDNNWYGLYGAKKLSPVIRNED